MKRVVLNFFLCRLSYHQRLKELVPDNFDPLLPARPSPYYKYEQEGAGAKVAALSTFDWVFLCPVTKTC